MKVLVGCEKSGIVRQAFRAMGHDAWSCDLEPADDGSPYHIRGDVLQAILMDKWDLGIFHPPCTYLSVSGLHWNKRVPGRAKETQKAAGFFMACWESPIAKVAIENPVGFMSTIWRKPDQIIQPYQFGEDASKKTCLWLRGLPKLPIDQSKRFQGRMVDGKERWSNQTDSGQNKLPPSKNRAAIRSQTYQGIADAMAKAWG